MKYTSPTHRLIRVSLGSLMITTLSLLPLQTAIAQSSWSPTQLVNTESFQILDEGDGTTDIELRFGDTVDERIYWERAFSRFRFTDDVHVEGNITGSGTLTVDGEVRTKDNLTINANNAGQDAVLTFGNDAGVETVTFSDTTNRFEFSDDVSVVGVLSGSSLTVDHNADVGGDLGVEGTVTIEGATQINNTLNTTGNITTDANLSGATVTATSLKACTLVYTDINGNLVCSTDSIVTQSAADERYVNRAGDTMTGDLVIGNNAGLSASGNIVTESNLTLNDNNSAADAVITFGNDDGVESLTYADTAARFEFTDDLSVTGVLSGSSLRVDQNADIWGNLTVSGSTTIDGALQVNNTIDATGNIRTDGNLSGSTLTVDGAITIKGVTYEFPDADGANGTKLTTDGAGNLTWASGSDNGSGSILSFHPEYPNAIYQPDGTSNVGTLSLTGSGLGENVYRWESSRPTLQDYDIIVRVRVPDNFSSWDPVQGITLRYETGLAAAANNAVSLEILDTAGASDHTVANTASTSFADMTATAADLDGTYTPGGYMTVRVKLSADNTAGSFADASYLNFYWETSTP